MPLLFIARFLLAWVFLRSAQDVLREPEPRAESAAWLLDPMRGFVPFLPEDNLILVRANAAVQLAAAGLLLTGRLPRLAALVMAASMVPTTLGGHAYWRHDDPTRRSQHQVHFNKNVAIVGGLLLVVALDTPASRGRRR
jgi:putative oxidoreductase